ncbi:MAG: hypothetical protein A2033_17050 [Bacteroidetes bacterium GWA2_31_9]|nr:MAG: hypothetical protein A2033_17050 [Bacteroidetes bacterium GWA2_31_9]
MIKAIDSLNVLFSGQIVGRLIIAPDGLALFEYNYDWLKTGFSISPFYLPLKQGTFTAKQKPFGGLFGIFNDSLPDGWGNLLIDRLLKKHGINPNSISFIERLSIVGNNGLGALSYKPENYFKSLIDSNDIEFLSSEVTKILNEQETENIELLYNKNCSSGGARPKVFLKIKDDNWLIKFPNSHDSNEIGKIEYEYSIIAKKCGIEMPETKIFEGNFFGVKRFDIIGKEKIHVHSVAGLLYADFRLPSLDYIELGKATWTLTHNFKEVEKLFRLMVFNVLAGNKDDHSKNFSFIYENNNWKLSPAYDLTPSYGFNNNHSTTIAGQGNPTKKDIFEVSIQLGINKKNSELIFDEVFENCKPILVADFL